MRKTLAFGCAAAFLAAVALLPGGADAQDKKSKGTELPDRPGRGSENNLKQIGLAIHNFHDVNGFLPSGIVDAKTKKPLLSWRVAVLPYLEQDALYNQFKFDEAWDGP